MAVRPRDPRSGEREPVPFGIAGLTPAAALWALVERSLLTLAEVRMLEQAAAGSRPVLSLLGITQRQASMALDRWRGPIPGVRFRELAHWGTAIVRGGAPLTEETLSARAGLNAGDGNPFSRSQS
jgi:hypothetical protein